MHKSRRPVPGARCPVPYDNNAAPETWGSLLNEPTHKRMNNRAPTRPRPQRDPDPNRLMPTVHSHVISSIVFCLPCLLRGSAAGSRYATGSGLRLGLGPNLGLALLINTSSAGLVMELAHDMNVDM